MNWDWEKLQQQHKERNTGGSPIKPPHVDDIVSKFKEFKFPGGWLIVVLAGVALILLSSTIYMVDTDEVGVVQRFGKYMRTETAGLNFKLPIGIEKVTKVSKKVENEVFGSSPNTSDANNEALMLTGDLNVGVVPWLVQYRIKDPYNFMFKVDHAKLFLRDMSEASMRLVVGDRSINEVINSRAEIAIDAKERLQKELDEAETGIEIVTVELGNTNVPGPVQDSFNEVNQAVQEKERIIYQAQEEYNRVIPKARGEAEQAIKSSEGYAIERVNEAKGDADRFIAQYNEYSKSKDVTRRRLYLEMVKIVFPNLGELNVIDSEQKNVLPLFNMGEWGKKNEK